MALYLMLTYDDGTEEAIPVLNREAEEIDRHVESATVEHSYVTGRGSLTERTYRGGDLTRVIKALREGDEIEVETHPESYGDESLTITKATADDYIGENGNGDKFYLLPTYWGERGQGDGQPWLRTKDGFDSRGEIEQLTIASMSNE